MAEGLDRLQERLHYRFQDADLARLALTHRSANQNSNERLEFLGDALLDFLVGEMLYSRFPAADEGELTRLRAGLVNKRALARIGRDLELADLIQRSSGDLKSGGRHRQSTLADAVEAIVAAVYLDGGMDQSRSLVERLTEPLLAAPDLAQRSKDYKTRLQECMQAKGLELPSYRVLEITGEAHQQTFHVECRVPARSEATSASGSSKRQAEQEAASRMLDAMEQSE